MRAGILKSAWERSDYLFEFDDSARTDDLQLEEVCGLTRLPHCRKRLALRRAVALGLPCCSLALS
jgi:hypothetical protein